MLRDFLRNSNLRESKSLVKISTNCYLVGTNSREMTLSSTKSLMKWWRISMCLVWEWRTWFLEILIALELSQCYWDWAPKNKTWCNKVRFNYPFAICLVYWHWFEHLVHVSYIVHDFGALGVVQKIQVMSSL